MRGQSMEEKSKITKQKSMNSAALSSTNVNEIQRKFKENKG